MQSNVLWSAARKQCKCVIKILRFGVEASESKICTDK